MYDTFIWAYIDKTDQIVNYVWLRVMNIDGFEDEKKLSFICKAFNLSTVKFLYLAMRVPQSTARACNFWRFNN